MTTLDFARAWSRHFRELSVAQWLIEPQQMQPVAAAENWGIPEIESPGALAEWFGISTGELRWFSDLKGLVYEKDRSTLRHYHYRVLAKQSGNIRLIEAPKPRLKELQRQVLSRILESVPPHASVHGFLKGHSIKTFAAPHVGRRIILRMDLQDFFLPFPAQEFRASSARWATPNRLPICSAESARTRHLGTLGGTSESTSIAFICGKRKTSMLVPISPVGAEYTRYADDLAFSIDETSFERRVERFSTHVAAILMEEVFQCITARPALCVAACANTVRAWLLIGT